MHQSQSLVSLVIPVFNEEESISPLLRRIEQVSQSLNYEVIFANDGSFDATESVVTEHAARNNKVKLINLSRNFGHQAAVSAGLRYARGDAVIVMDGDLQDPPELIPDFLAAWSSGAHVAYAVRHRRKEGPMKRLAYWSFYRLWKSLASIDVPVDSGDFCLMDRKVVDILNSLPEKQRFVRGLRSWVGFKQVPIPYERNARQHGKVKYSLPMLMGLAADGIFSFSRRPLTAIAKIGFIVSCVSLSSILVVLYIRLFTNLSLPGFASIASILLFLGGVQLFAIGIVGEYIARIFDEVKDRPTFLVATTVNIEEAEGEGI